MIYLASVDVTPNSPLPEQRFDEACRTVAHLIGHGCVVYSPVIYHHVLAQHGLPLDSRFWRWIDRAYLRECDEVVLLESRARHFSRALTSDVAFARDIGKPIGHLPMSTVRRPTLALQHAEERA